MVVLYTFEVGALLLDHSATFSIFFAFVGDTAEESEICQKQNNQLS